MSSHSTIAGSAERVGPFQLALLVLSILTLVAIAADTFFRLDPEVSRILQGVDVIACGAFFFDFLVRFRRAESKTEFMRMGWIDLLACIPNVDALRVGRFVRVLRILRLLRGVRSLQRLLRMIFANKTRGGVTSVAMTMFLLVVFSSVAILLCEKDEDANIKSAGDAVWWSVTTVTTVGYGDRYPVSFEGRILAMTLMLAGVGLFGALSGIIASLFLGQPDDDSDVMDELKVMKGELASIRAATAQPFEIQIDPPPTR
jgi:voltage-gated potassium channel